MIWMCMCDLPVSHPLIVVSCLWKCPCGGSVDFL